MTPQPPTETADPQTIMTQVLADQRRAQQQAVVDLVNAARPKPALLTTIAELELEEPFVLPDDPICASA